MKVSLHGPIRWRRMADALWFVACVGGLAVAFVAARQMVLWPFFVVLLGTAGAYGLRVDVRLFGGVSAVTGLAAAIPMRGILPIAAATLTVVASSRPCWSNGPRRARSRTCLALSPSPGRRRSRLDGGPGCSS
jgi:hypothetical protein